MPGTLLLLAFLVTISRLFFALLGAAMHSRFGVELSGIQYGVLVAAIFTGWMASDAATGTVPALVRDGLPHGAFATVLAASPTSWPVRAVEAAAAGSPGAAAGWLVGLAGLTAAAAAVTIALLVPRPGGRRPPSPRRRARPGFGRRLPDSALGAVLGKELRLWRRDPWRRLELRTMMWAALISGGLALITGYQPLVPYAGLIAAFGTALAALNLYGQDGTALWQLVVGATAATVRADVRGRQLAVVLVSAPPALLITVAGVLLTGAHHLWPLLLALLAILLGAGSGLGLLLSVVAATPGVDPRERIGPNDAGDVTVQVWTALLAMPVLVLPAASLAVAAMATGSAAAQAAVVAGGAGYGFALAWWLGRLAHQRLAARLPETFTRLRYGPAAEPGVDHGLPARHAERHAERKP